jgi:hypothetical protein
MASPRCPAPNGGPTRNTCGRHEQWPPRSSRITLPTLAGGRTLSAVALAEADAAGVPLAVVCSDGFAYSFIFGYRM